MEDEAAVETAQLEASVKATLIANGLTALTVSMSIVNVVTGMHPDVEWRVDVLYVGDPIVIDSQFIVAMATNINGMGGVHQNSLWVGHSGLVTKSHVPDPS